MRRLILCAAAGALFLCPCAGAEEPEGEDYGHRIISGGQSLMGTGAGVGSSSDTASGRNPKPELPQTLDDVYDVAMKQAADCNSTPEYCDSPVFVRSWEMLAGKFVGVAYGSGRPCCTHFCGHVRSWWFGKDAPHGAVFDDTVEDPEDPEFSDGAVAKFCAYALPRQPPPERCECSLAIISGGDSCYTGIPKGLCGEPLKVSIAGWKDLFVCKGPAPYCLKHR